MRLLVLVWVASLTACSPAAREQLARSNVRGLEEGDTVPTGKSLLVARVVIDAEGFLGAKYGLALAQIGSRGGVTTSLTHTLDGTGWVRIPLAPGTYDLEQVRMLAGMAFGSGQLNFEVARRIELPPETTLYAGTFRFERDTLSGLVQCRLVDEYDLAVRELRVTHPQLESTVLNGATNGPRCGSE